MFQSYTGSRMPKTECLEETRHSSRLLLHSSAPYNAETPLHELVEHNYTPEELMYCRNHCKSTVTLFSYDVTDGQFALLPCIGSVPPFSEETFTVNIDGEVEKELEFTISELASTFPRKTVVAALQVSFIEVLPSPHLC